MNKKLKIALGIALVVVSISYLLCYIFLKEETTYFTECLIDFINKPLPIIGVSIVVVMAFIYKCFVSTKYGRRALKELRDEKELMFEQLNAEKENIIKENEKLHDEIKEQQEKLNYYENCLIELCEYSRNRKARDLANEIRGYTYGEETKDSNTREE